MPKPLMIVLPPLAASSTTVVSCAPSAAAARDSSDAPALRTSAQAVPSGYLRYPCWATISARRNGIIIRIPSNPPSTDTSITRDSSRSNPRIKIAGIVTPMPKAIDSPADPAVCTTLFSRMVASRNPNLDNTRKSVIEITATGIEALTVSPTFSTRYNDEAPKTIPRIVPTISGRIVSSRNLTPAGM